MTLAPIDRADRRARWLQVKTLRDSNQFDEAERLEREFRLADVRDAYIASMPADVRQQLDTAQDAATQAKHALSVAEEAAARARAELVDAEATSGVPHKRLESLRTAWADARRDIDQARAESELRADVAARIESRYLDTRLSEEQEATALAIRQARADWRSAADEIEQHLPAIAEARRRLQEAINREAAACRRIGQLTGTEPQPTLPSTLPHGIPNEDEVNRVQAAFRARGV